MLLLAIVAGTLGLAFSVPPFGQDAAYHGFADRRVFAGIPNFLDVSSSALFLLVGAAGLRYCCRPIAAGLRAAWLVFFAGVALTGIGSAWYHLAPDDARLVWDRLPMTLGFMALCAALLAEYVGASLGRRLLLPALLLGLASVLWWRGADDLRLYAWVQSMPLLLIPSLMALYRPAYSRQWLLLAALGLYVLAKAAEIHDAEVFALTGRLVGGHALKHALAALACSTLLVMLVLREPVSRASAH